MKNIKIYYRIKAWKFYVLLTLLFALFFNTSEAAIKTSTTTGGTWSVAGTWVGGVAPLATDTVIISSGSTVTINSSTVIRRLEISGILKFSAGSLNVNGTLLINNLGNFQPFGRSFAVNGDFTNNGTTPLDLSQTGTTFRMGTPEPAVPTSISGTGSFKYTGGIIRTLRIDNKAGVTLSVPVSVASTLELLQGSFTTGSNLTLNNTAPGLGAAIAAFKLVRQQTGSLVNGYTLNPSATLNIEYSINITLDAVTVTSGAEIPSSRIFNSLTINNPMGLNLTDDITLSSATAPLILSDGRINVISGKTITCSSASYNGASASLLSYINGALALTLGTSASTKTYPLGKNAQLRTVTLAGVSASGTAQVRFDILDTLVGTAETGKILFGKAKWHGSVTSGSLATYSSIGLNYSFLDGVNTNTEIMLAPALSGTFNSLGTGIQNSLSITLPTGTYSSLGYFGFGGTPLSFSNSITNSVLQGSNVNQYKKAEWNIGVSASFINPYKESEIALDMILTAPSSKKIKLPCYYDADRGLVVSKWKARFMPQESGTYTYKFILSLNGIKVDSTTLQSFSAISNSVDKGILHYNGNPWVLNYDSGSPFRGIGNNIGWEKREDESIPTTYTYDYFIPRLVNSGANFMRIFMNNYNMPIEWNLVELEHQNSRYNNSSETYNPDGIKRFDEFVKLNDSLGMHVMLMLEWQCNLRPDVNWYYNPYNIANGGPAATPGDFFINTEAKRMFKSRLRYMIARWGYSPSIGMWELMNEIDNALYKTQTDGQGNTTFTDEQLIPDSYAVAWHTEMAAYLKQNDPYNHIVTTSIGFRTIAGLWSVPNIDINQEHMYNYTDFIPSRLTNRLAAYNRPTVIGEFAVDYTNPSPARWNEFNYDFKKGLWYGLFNPTPVLPINWFWVLWETQNGFSYYNSIKEINNLMLTAGSGSFVKKTSSATGLLTASVKCGSIYFTHILNNDAINKSSSITLAVDPSLSYSVKFFDPETFQYTSPIVYTSNSTGVLTLPSTSFNVRQQKVIISTPVSSLPVAISDFTVKADGNRVKVNWVTTSERDNDKFVIEKSLNASDFDVMSVVKGKTNSNKKENYTSYDYEPKSGFNYYKLTQYDNNGKATLLGIKAVNFGEIPVVSLKVYAEENRTAIHFNISGYPFNKINVALIDVNGKIYQKQPFEVNSEGFYTLNLSSAPPVGVYLLQISDGNLTKVVKVFLK